MLKKTKLVILAVVLVFAFGQAAYAGLATVGPFNDVNTSNGFPMWYTDANGVTVELPVPPIGDGTGKAGTPTMVFAPLTPTSNAYARQAGFDTEAFFFNAVTPKTFLTKFGKCIALFGIEASYANGIPTAGQQIVFARIRITADIKDAKALGVYTFYHPWGSETINVTATGTAAIKFTKDVGLTLGWLSDGAGGWLPSPSPGGFYNVLQPGNTMSTFLRAVSPAPPANWIGDGVTTATFTGSPIGYNKVRLQAPTGVDLDGRGNNFVETNQLVISGHIPATLTLPLPLSVDRSTCSFINGAESIDLFLTSKQGATVTVTDAALGTILWTGTVADVSGKYYHSFPGTAKSITVAVSALGFSTTAKTVAVIDYVNIISANYSLGGNTLTVTATSSDWVKHPTTPPVLTVTGFGTMTVDALGNFTLGPVAVTAPLPPTITVTSSVGGSDTIAVAIVP